MTQPSPALRFGIEVDGRRSYTWRVRSGAQHPELFVERENLADITHLSLHASGKWHIKAHNRTVYKWVRPAEFTPGYTRALAIVQPVVVATITLPAPADAQVLKLLKLPDDTEPCISTCGSSDLGRTCRAGPASAPWGRPLWAASLWPMAPASAVW